LAIHAREPQSGLCGVDGGARREKRPHCRNLTPPAGSLRQNYEALQSWPLAITAYNHGKEGMARAVEQVQSRDLADIIERYDSPNFGFASSNFYSEFSGHSRN
jgi:hypothetical protein